jgi:hypothetical protein
MVPLSQSQQLPAMLADHCSETVGDGTLAPDPYPWPPG